MLSMALRLSENSGKQCIALRYIKSSTIRSCVVDNSEREREGERLRQRQTPDKRDCLDYLSVSDVRSALWTTMASRITVTEIRPRWERERGGERGEERERAREEEWRVENRDVTRLEESSVITASQPPVWSWGMAEGCKAFEADNPFVMITHVFQCARWSSLSYCIMGSRRQLPLGPAWLWAAVGIVGSAANLPQYL